MPILHPRATETKINRIKIKCTLFFHVLRKDVHFSRPDISERNTTESVSIVLRIRLAYWRMIMRRLGNLSTTSPRNAINGGEPSRKIHFYLSRTCESTYFTCFSHFYGFSLGMKISYPHNYPSCPLYFFTVFYFPMIVLTIVLQSCLFLSRQLL